MQRTMLILALVCAIGLMAVAAFGAEEKEAAKPAIDKAQPQRIEQRAPAADATDRDGVDTKPNTWSNVKALWG